MNNKTIYERLQQIEDEIQRLNNTLFALKTTDIKVYGKRYEELSTSAALRSERITCQLRNLVFTISSSGKSDYLKQAADVQGIQISSSEQILTITLPGLLPKRKVRTNTAFLHEPLNLALQTYILEHPIQLYQNCVVCFSQIYDQNLSLHRVRDYDNLEFKQILDTIAAYVLVDDTGLLCDSYHTKWEYKTEVRLTAFLQHYLQGRPYHGRPAVRAIMTGKDMDTAYHLLTSTGGYRKSLFLLDTTYEHFHYLPNNIYGEYLLRLLVRPQMLQQLDRLLLSDYFSHQEELPIEHDGIDSQNHPVLLAYDFDMQRINRFNTGLNVYDLSGILVCFDFQIPCLRKYLTADIQFSSIDFQKFKRGFFHEKP